MIKYFTAYVSELAVSRNICKLGSIDFVMFSIILIHSLEVLLAQSENKNLEKDIVLEALQLAKLLKDIYSKEESFRKAELKVNLLPCRSNNEVTDFSATIGKDTCQYYKR